MRLLGATRQRAASARAAANTEQSTIFSRTASMAEDLSNLGNGSGEPGTDPQVSVLAQYIKDLSGENTSAPPLFQWQAQPSLDVQFQLNANKVGDDVHEVSLRIEATARSENG